MHSEGKLWFNSVSDDPEIIKLFISSVSLTTWLFIFFSTLSSSSG
jgi:hypothetical protein